MTDEPNDSPPKQVKRRAKDDPRGPSLARRLAAITPEDTDTEGRPIVYGYGIGHIITLSGRARATVRKAIAGGVPMHMPAHAVAWAIARRGRPDLADDVLVTLGYARRYTTTAEI